VLRSVLASAPLVALPLYPAAAGQDAAATSSAASATPPAASKDQAENTGDDFARPVNVIQLYDQYVTAPRSGGQPGTIREVTTETLKLRADQRIDLPGPWKLALREDLPFEAKNPINAANPSGDYVYGVGDVHAQAALIREIDARWTIGFGSRLVAPTGDASLGLGSGKWRIMPVIGVRYALPEISDGSYFEPQLWYDQSFAGGLSKQNISNLRFAPVWRIALPDRWFVTFYPSPDIRVNYGDPITGQTGRLFLPLDFQLGRSLANNLTVSIEVAVPIIRDYPVYDFKTAARLNLTF
jgi:hypothetical protein